MIHTYSLNGYNIVVDENSGAVHVLDVLTYEMLKNEVELPTIDGAIRKLGNKYSKEDIVEGFEEILSLKEQGILFSSIKKI